MTDAKQEQQKFDFAFPAEQEVSAEDPWRDDKLGRERFAKGLTNLAKGAGGAPFVAAVHGEWGSGKTFMLRRWQRQMEKDGCKAIYFNAWEDDFHANPLVAIVGQIWGALKGGSLKEITKSVKDNFKVAGDKILGTIGLTRNDLSSVAEQSVDEYAETRRTLDDLRKRLRELGAAVMKKTGAPLVFVVDELDRCRPTFAIELLERVKHIFSVQGVVFVLGINKTQLEKSIKSVYGEIDAEDYLLRFFDKILVLPPAAPDHYANYLMELHKTVLHIGSSEVHRAKYGFRSHSGSWQPAMEQFYSVMVERMGFSLREIQHSFRLLLFVVHTKEKKDSGESTMLPWEGFAALLLALLKVKNSELYRNFIHGDATSMQVIEYFAANIRNRSMTGYADNTEYLIAHVEEVFYCLTKSKDYAGTMSELKICAAKNSEPAGGYKYVSPKIQAKAGRAKELIDHMERTNEDRPYSNSYLREVAALLEWGDIR